jgi:hypothetical protein
VSGERGKGKVGGSTAFPTNAGSSHIDTEQGWTAALPELSEEFFHDNCDVDNEEDHEMGRGEIDLDSVRWWSEASTWASSGEQEKKKRGAGIDVRVLEIKDLY